MMRSDSDDNLQPGKMAEEQLIEEEDPKSSLELRRTRKDWRKLWHSQQQYWREKGVEETGSEECVIFDDHDDDDLPYEESNDPEALKEDLSIEDSGSGSNQESQDGLVGVGSEMSKSGRKGWGLLGRLQPKPDGGEAISEVDLENAAELSGLLTDVFTIGSLNSLNDDEETERRLWSELEGEHGNTTIESESSSKNAWTVLKRSRQSLDAEKSSATSSNPVDESDNTQCSLEEKDASPEEADAPAGRWTPLRRLRQTLDGEKKRSDFPGIVEKGSDDDLESKTQNDEKEILKPEKDPDADDADEHFNSRWAMLKTLRQRRAVEHETADDHEAADTSRSEGSDAPTPDAQAQSPESCSERLESITEEMQEQNSDTIKSPRKGWGLLKRVQQRLADRSDVTHQPSERLDEPSFIASVTSLHTRNEELEDLVRDLQESQKILKDECKLNAAKVRELTEASEARQNNVVEEKLLNKSIQNAELSMKLDDLAMALEKANSSINRLEKERTENVRLTDGMCNVIVALHCAQDKAPKLLEKSKSAEKLTVDELEKKVKDIMEDRERLVNKCNNLELDNELKDAQIDDLVEALDSQAFMYDAESSDEKHKEDDHSVQSEMTKSTCASTAHSSVSMEMEDSANSKFRSLYRSVSSRMMRGVADDEHSVISMASAKSETTQSTYGVSLSASSIPDHRDDVESIKERMNTSDPKYIEFLTLMKGTEMAGEPFRSISEEPDEFEKYPEENASHEEFAVDLVV